MGNFLKPSKRVMVIDDSEIDVIIFKKMIGYADCNVQTDAFYSGYSALEYFEYINPADSLAVPQIIFLDLNMPLMNGYSFLDELAKLKGNYLDKCKVYILSSSDNPKDMLKAKQYKCVDRYIIKPILPHDLLNILSKTESDEGVKVCV